DFSRWIRVIVTATTIIGVVGAWWYVHVETSRPDIQLAYRLARFLDGAVRNNDRVLILAKPVTEETSNLYLEKARQTGGEAGFQRAREELRQTTSEPPDFQRVRVYSHIPRERLLIPPAPCGEWIALWSDYPHVPETLSAARPVEILRSGPLSVLIIRAECKPYN